MRRLVFALLVVSPLAFGAPPAADAAAPWIWPVAGPVLEAFDPPDSPYGSGHRGIDIAAPVGANVVAPAGGTVTFSGYVGGRLFVTIDHGGGLESTASWLTSRLVRRGDTVVAGTPIAATGWGHPDAVVPHLHLGVRLDDVYVDPLSYLTPVDVTAFIRLAPVLTAM